MGDVVHTLPTITDIAAHLPGTVIDWVVEKPFASLPAMHPAVRRVIPIAWRKWRKSLWNGETRAALAEARRALKAEPYDLVLDFQGLVKSALWAAQAQGPRAGYDRASAREPLAALFYQRTANVSKSLHAVERSRRLAAAHVVDGDFLLYGTNGHFLPLSLNNLPGRRFRAEWPTLKEAGRPK